MNVSASDFYSYYSPSPCELRVYLRGRNVPEAAPGQFEALLRRLGLRHEQSHLASFPEVADLTQGSRAERERRTSEALEKGVPVLYQPGLRRLVMLNGIEVEVLGDPDFLIRDGERYLVRDCKLSRRITERDHPEILRQLELYGWLAEKSLGYVPLRLEVYNGLGDLVPVPYDGGVRALSLIQNLLKLKAATAEPYSPVGWSKCSSCGYHERCWPPAVATRDVAVVSGVDQGLAVGLRGLGVHSVDQLLAKFDVDSLAALRRPWGMGLQRVGSKAANILRMAQAFSTGEEQLIATPGIPTSRNYVMFDLEGIPSYMDELDKIYLWGLRVYGDVSGPYLAANAGFGPSGDREGWEAFLINARTIFTEFGDLPFVHWSSYEKSRLDSYVQRFGDLDGIAARVRLNLCDLLRVTQDAIALPLPSYGLKVVEKYVGFVRKLKEGGGEWAIVKYIEAVETSNEPERAAIVQEILAYNEEDLGATWSVLQWLKAKIH